MEEEKMQKKNKRWPWVAVTLSVIMTGLGHIYCGRIVKGLVLTFVSCIVIPFMFGAFSVSHSSIRIAVIVATLLASSVIWLFAIIDSGYIAGRIKENYIPKDYNRWYLYVILILMGTGGSTQIAFNVRTIFLEPFRVPVASGYPTVIPDDRFLANKIAYKNSDPQKGDLIVFINPEDRKQNYIKRVVAVAGETVEIRNGELYVNDQKLSRQKLPQSTLDDMRIQTGDKPLEGDVFEETNGDATYKIFLANHKPLGDFAKMTVPKHHCFVLGDNRNLSYDSRNFGPVLLATVKGRADYLYFPAKDWSRFGKIR
ncbi:MAG: signal peptidase I [Phycisphaerae bacterium]|nr:signal peptidase I [Phycisphaerae bacterium]NIP50675.1 signal peptidase I [Phycisphaerae bacterium]NIS52360.1 signal peptidase I [Phycisphaerae bacterium]NIU11921.1 signal peptidase I [Phycisphaerae bacterium]NIU57566.1 signal peptidase I [Phycisphaerae bacterium]